MKTSERPPTRSEYTRVSMADDAERLKEEEEEEDDDEDDIATHPRARSLMARSLTAEEMSDEEPIGALYGKRKRSKPTGGKKFEPLGGLMTARRSRTSSSAGWSTSRHDLGRT